MDDQALWQAFCSSSLTVTAKRRLPVRARHVRSPDLEPLPEVP